MGEHGPEEAKIGGGPALFGFRIRGDGDDVRAIETGDLDKVEVGFVDPIVGEVGDPIVVILFIVFWGSFFKVFRGEFHDFQHGLKIVGDEGRELAEGPGIDLIDFPIRDRGKAENAGPEFVVFGFFCEEFLKVWQGDIVMAHLFGEFCVVELPGSAG